MESVHSARSCRTGPSDLSGGCRQEERDSIETDLADLVESSWATRIHGLDFNLIETWKAQFGVGE